MAANLSFSERIERFHFRILRFSFRILRLSFAIFLYKKRISAAMSLGPGSNSTEPMSTIPEMTFEMPRWSVVKPEFVSPPAGLIAREAFSGTRVRVGTPLSLIAARSGLSGEAAVPTKSPSAFAAPATGGLGKSISAPSLLPIWSRVTHSKPPARVTQCLHYSF